MPTWWTRRPSIVNGRRRGVTSALARIAARGVETLTQSRFAMPCSPASSGLSSTKSSG
jgi:hypothetical protein